jgi:hypothetical protein
MCVTGLIVAGFLKNNWRDGLTIPRRFQFVVPGKEVKGVIYPCWVSFTGRVDKGRALYKGVLIYQVAAWAPMYEP